MNALPSISYEKLETVGKGLWGLLREGTRHLLRHPVTGIAVAAETEDQRWLLIRRGDTGRWALPGGTLEWGETLSAAAYREVSEETGATLLTPPELCGVYSDPSRDYRFHAVTVLVRAQVSMPSRPPLNSVEIREVKPFAREELPTNLSLGMDDMLQDALQGRRVLE